MADVDVLRAQLARIRVSLERKRSEAVLAHETVRRTERDLAELGRRSRESTERDRQRLRRQLAIAEDRKKDVDAELDRLRAEEDSLRDDFDRFSDPTTHLETLGDRSPILLFPLRLETRFRTGPHGGPQLWVRVYPDSCLVDTFEPSLAEREVENARAFWTRFWHAGGDEPLERAAWRELVAAHGSGRSRWILRNYMPLNPDDKPDDPDAADVFLIVTAPAALTGAVPTYWEAAWRAGGDAEAMREAFDDLVAAVGEPDARTILERHRPYNFDDPPPAGTTRETARVVVAVLELPPIESLETRRTSWSQPSRIELLPDRFVVVAYPFAGAPITMAGGRVRVPLSASPDPNAPPAQALKQVDDTLQIPADLAWMFDFDAAEAVGMAIRVDVSAAQAREGFARVIVLGVRLGDDAEHGVNRLAGLLEHHLHSRAGLEILPQGTPTNNTESAASGYAFRDDADASFAAFVRNQPLYDVEPDVGLRRDGQWLADLLALPHALVQQVPHADGFDRRDAMAMQTALWPATLGYMMKSELTSVFSTDTVEWTRAFFSRYVTGRGPLPALRIGRQPYGILPTAAFGRMTFLPVRPPSRAGRLHAMLMKIDEHWQPLADALSYIGKPGSDPHQVLLDVLGLHPASVEYHPLQAESVDHKFHELSFFSFPTSLDFLSAFPAILPLMLLRDFGYTGAEVPDLLNKVFKARQTPLTGPVIDDRPLSEREPIRDYAGDRNYIEWLAAAARTGITALQEEQGFDGGRPPAALLYLLLRHALQLGFHETSIKLHVDAQLIEDAQAARREPAFVHVGDRRRGSESRYDLLFKTQESITGSNAERIGDFIARTIITVDPGLKDQVDALDQLAPLSTAKLERLFAEHIDCCSHRLDAWKTGLLAAQLETLRQPGDGAAAGRGLYLGAYGWMESLRPSGRVLTPAQLPRDVEEPVNRRAAAPLMRDPANAGLIHAMSINHATTAAVLRNGYLANDGRLAVNLTSRRVRLALDILEGMRNGQSLGALLGYKFERHIHDHGPIGVRELIYPLRRAFPLAANQIETTSGEPGTAQESISAVNVVDGRRLIEYVEGLEPPNFIYPFDLSTLPPRPAAEEQAITDALAHIRDINDAVADLILAEGVHQAVLGNYERSSGTLDAFAKGNYPPEPDVIRTPRTGIALTLRAAIHFSDDPPGDPLPGLDPTPLAIAEPAVNVWLRDRLPLPVDVGCPVVFTDRATDAEQQVFIDQAQLGLHPIDLLYRVQANGDQALGDIDALILRRVHTAHGPRHDRPIVIHHTARVAGKASWFALQALLRSLRSLLASRPLQPADVMRANDATMEQQAMVSLPVARVVTARDHLRNELLPALDALAATLADVTVPIDEALDEFAATVAEFAAYRIPQTGVGFVYEWRHAAYSALVQRIRQHVETWDRRLSRFDARVDEYDNLPAATPDDERFARLGSAEAIVSTVVTRPLPPDPDDYRGTVLVARRAAFVAKRHELAALVDAAQATLAGLVEGVRAALPLTAFDVTDFDVSADVEGIERFRAQLAGAVTSLRQEVTGRLARVDDRLAAVGPTASDAATVSLLQEAGKILFGDDFQYVPHLTLPATAVEELAHAWNSAVSGASTAHLAGAHEFPLDDWLHGVARVRGRMRDWENVVLLTDPEGTAGTSDLTPLQIPSVEGEPWLGLEIPAGHEITSDRLLYTAHFAAPFDQARPICGLLIDEWTEVVPDVRETTGLAFQYDRPNSEAPQSWLLAVPASVGDDSRWSWGELLAAVVDALDSARQRAIEPVHVGTTPYSWFLPATMAPYTFPEISVSNNLLRNLSIYADIARSADGPA